MNEPMMARKHRIDTKTLQSKRTWLALSLGLIPGLQQYCFGDDDRKPTVDSVQLPPKAEVPVLAPASSDGENAIKGFRIPKDWTVKLFAAEPLTGNPVAFAVDGKGRVVVCESYRQNKGVTDNRGHDATWLQADLSANTVEDRIAYHRKLLGDKASEYETQDDLLRLLTDTDGDGVADKATVFASGFNGLEEGTGAGALIRGNQIYYTNIPKLWSLVDKDGDGVADERVVMSDGYGVRVAFRGHDMHGLIMGPDGRLYFSIGDRGYHVRTENGVMSNPESGAVFRCELDGSKLEVFASGLRNPQELAFDDFGSLFTGDNNSDSGDRARWVNVVRGGDSGWRMMYQYISDRGPFNREKIWYPYSEETPAYIVPPILNLSDGPSGLVCYPGTGMGAENKNAFFLCDFRGQASNSGIRKIRVEPNGAFFKVVENEEFIWNILATDVDFGPDGAMIVSDWVNGWNGENKGRLYRFYEQSQIESDLVVKTAKLLREGMESRPTAELVGLLQHDDRRVRLEAQWQLAKLRESKALAGIASNASMPLTARLHGVWGLGQIARNKPDDSIAVATLIECVSDNDAMIASRSIEMLADARIASAADVIVNALKSESLVVQSAACLAVNQLHLDAALPAVVKVLVANADADPIVRHSAIMALAGMNDGSKVVALAKHVDAPVRLAAVVALRKAENPGIREFLGDSSLAVVKEAVRAIHDVPALHSQLGAVADLLIAPGNDDAVVSRVLNANFRLGKTSNAERIAAYAAREDAPIKHRLDALDMLAQWGKPGLNDRVMNRFMPLEDRSTDDVIRILRSRIPELTAAPAAVRDRFLEIGAKYGITEVQKLLEQTVTDPKIAGARRAASLTALAALNPDSARSLIKTLASESDLDLKLSVLGIQVKLTPSEAIEPLQKAVSSAIVRERQTAWDLLSELPESKDRDTTIMTGVQWLLKGELKRDSMLNVIETAKKSLKGPMLIELTKMEETMKSLKETEPAKAYADCVEGGNVANGREIFFTRSSVSCVRCHKVGTTGGEVGPVLSEIGNSKSLEYLVEAVVAPNLAIAKGFETVQLIDDEDQIITGILKSETDSTLTLMDSQGVNIQVDKESIVARKPGLSSMPVDIMKNLSRRDLRDLVAYLKSLDGTPEATAGLDAKAEGHKVE